MSAAGGPVTATSKGHDERSRLRRGTPRDGRVIALFGPRADLIGWEAVHEGRPSARLLGRVRHFAGVAAR